MKVGDVVHPVGTPAVGFRVIAKNGGWLWCETQDGTPLSFRESDTLEHRHADRWREILDHPDAPYIDSHTAELLAQFLAVHVPLPEVAS